MKNTHIIALSALLALGLVATACGNKNEAQKESSAPKAAEVKTPGNSDGSQEATLVTYDNFMLIEMGSDKASAEDLFGPGEKIEGIEGHEIYTWQGQGIGNMVLIFSDNKVVEKSQSDLADRSAEITAEQAAGIAEGMALADAEGQLGPAVLISERQDDTGVITKTYEWKNTNGSALTATVQHDVILSSIPIGLT